MIDDLAKSDQIRSLTRRAVSTNAVFTGVFLTVQLDREAPRESWEPWRSGQAPLPQAAS